MHFWSGSKTALKTIFHPVSFQPTAFGVSLLQTLRPAARLMGCNLMYTAVAVVRCVLTDWSGCHTHAAANLTESCIIWKCLTSHQSSITSQHAHQAVESSSAWNICTEKLVCQVSPSLEESHLAERFLRLGKKDLVQTQSWRCTFYKVRSCSTEMVINIQSYKLA